MANIFEAHAIRHELRWMGVGSGAREAPEVEALVDLELRLERGGVAFQGHSEPEVQRHRLLGWRTCR
jgi:hypothetical protein